MIIEKRLPRYARNDNMGSPSKVSAMTHITIVLRAVIPRVGVE